MTKKINLNDFKNKKSKVLSGRPEGEQARKQLNLDKVDLSTEGRVFIVPEDIFSINSSFFLGLFGPSIRKLGRVGFDDKYKFECSEIIMKNIQEGIELALKNSNVLEWKNGPKRK